MTINTELETIFRAGLAKVDPFQMILDCMRLEKDRLVVRIDEDEAQIDLIRFNAVYLLGVGKAAGRMAQAVEQILGERLDGGLISTKTGHGAPLKKIRQIEAGHPVPDENSLRAGQEMNALAENFDERTLVINVISGGGSALLEALPSFEDQGQRKQITLGDLRRTTQVLMACGATINEINCIRKHLSLLKGGQFIRRIQPAQSINLILSDVVGDRLDTIASGLTCGDPTTFQDALDIIRRYRIEDAMPGPVMRYLELGMKGEVSETPKPGDPVFNSTRNLLIGTNARALAGAAEKAGQLSYHTAILTSQLTGEARLAAGFLLGIARDIRQRNLLISRPACVIAGGETTVTIHGSGLGGRNQEMALACLADMEKDPQACEGIYFLAASTDGSDGPTDATGAFASVEQLELAQGLPATIEEYLQNNDSYHFFEQTGGLLKTGPTQTNVCDVQIMIIR
ncbi:MAG TPA: glycerate kinase [Anaerolineaceae bacterium]|nr:glycerate kinase [Anaerolineaceae bacterium]